MCRAGILFVACPSEYAASNVPDAYGQHSFSRQRSKISLESPFYARSTRLLELRSVRQLPVVIIVSSRGNTGSAAARQPLICCRVPVKTFMYIRCIIGRALGMCRGLSPALHLRFTPRYRGTLAGARAWRPKVQPFPAGSRRQGGGQQTYLIRYHPINHAADGVVCCAQSSC